MNRLNNLISTKIFGFLICSITYLQTSAQLKEFFNDDFSSNKNQWSTGKIDGLYAEVKDGKYIAECGLKNLLNSQVVLGIDTTQDYSISVNLTISKSLNANSGGGIIFGSNISEYYAFFINSEGLFNIVEIKNNVTVSENYGTDKKAIKSGENVMNTLRIEKADLLWEFYVNDQRIKILPSKGFHGLYTGVLALSGAKYEFDNLKVSGTPVVTSGDFCKLFPLIYESAKDKFSYIMGIKTEKNQFACLNSQNPENIMTIEQLGSTSILSYSIKKYSTRTEAIDGLKKFIAEEEKCLPNYLFTEDKNAVGEISYKISEKVKKDKTIIRSQISLSKGNGPVDIFLTVATTK